MAITGISREKLVDIVLDQLREIANEISYYEYDVDYNVSVGDRDISVYIRIYTKFMEISEECSEYVSEYASDKEIDNDEELEELYNGCVEDLMSEINSNYAIYNEITVITDKVDIFTYPLECNEDYCSVGGEIVVRIKSLDYADVQHVLHYLKDIVKLYVEL